MRYFSRFRTYQALERAERWYFAAMVRPVLEQIFAPGISTPPGNSYNKLQHPGPGYRNHIEHHRFGHGDSTHASSIKLGELNPAPAGPNSGETNQMISKRALELAGLLGIAMALATFSPARAAGDDD